MTFLRNDHATIEAFARQLGLSARPGPDGSFAFRFAEDGVLTLVAANDGARVCVTIERAGPHGDAALRRALAGAGLDAASGALVHVSGHPGESLLYTVALEGGRLSLPDLETCLQVLLSKARH